MRVPNDFQERARALSGCGGIGVPHRHADGGFRIGRMQALPYRRIYAASLASRVRVRRLESVMKRT